MPEANRNRLARSSTHPTGTQARPSSSNLQEWVEVFLDDAYIKALKKVTVDAVPDPTKKK